MTHSAHLTPKERNGRGLDLLGTSLKPYVSERMSNYAGREEWLSAYQERESDRRGYQYRVTLDDPRALLRILRFERQVFTDIDATQRAWIDELIQWSNKAAHTSHFSSEEADRALDTMSLLAGSLGLEEILDDLTILRSGHANSDDADADGSDIRDPNVDVLKTDTTGSPDFALSGRSGSKQGDAENQGDADQLKSPSRSDDTSFVGAPSVPLSEVPHGTRSLSMRAGHLDVVVLYREAINYALVHNGVSPIVDIYLKNRGDSAVEDLSLELSIESPFEDTPVAGTLSIDLGALASSSEVELPTNMLVWRLMTKAFLKFDESLSMDMHLRVRSSGGKFHAQESVRLLPYDEWWAASIPEALAAFVRPNDPAIAELVTEASLLLEKRTGSSALSGYQAGPERVYQLAEAIYDAMANRQITYVEPPPSFEGTGQRIRSHSEVLGEHRGTCLDLACAYAAALEFAGLHPIVAVCEGHAFPGYLTDDAQLSDVALSFNAAIRTVVDSDLFDALETTALTADAQKNFDEARGAVRRWWGFDIDKVQYLLDVSRAHRVVKPLPSIRVEDGQTIIEQVREVTAAPARKVPRGPQEEVNVVADLGEPARIARWRRSLLDMTYNNPLLKLKKTGTVPVHVPTGMLAELEDAIAVGNRFTLIPHDDLAEIHLARGARTAADIESEVIAQILKDESRLYAALSRNEYPRVIRGLARRAQTGLEETGVNSLYLALATLEWNERGREGRAPLFLVPIKLTDGRGNRPYSIELDDTREVQPNYCLVEKLRVSWGLKLSVLINPGEDDAGLDVQGALATIRSELLRAGMTEFHIEETAHIALLQFSTLEMWRDLGDNWESFIERSAVRHLVETPGQTYIDDVDIPPASGRDEADLYLPIPADGSQIEAVRWAAAGKSFILEGPPGTGKSQTITNLIAHLLAEGKKVLFVAEKQAALEVVRRRLDAVGLGEFSLDLHGRNQTATKVREGLRTALEASSNGASSWETLRAAYRNVIEFLAQYPQHLHEEGPAGLSAWDAHQILLELREASAVEPAEVPRALVLGGIELAQLYEEARQLGTALSTLGVSPEASPWKISGPLSQDNLDTGEIADRILSLEKAHQAVCSSPTAYLTDQAATLGQLRAIAAWAALGSKARLPKQAAFTATVQWQSQSTSVLAAIGNFVGSYGPQMSAFVPEILDQNLQDLLVRAENADKKFFGKNKARLAVAAQMQPFLKQSQDALDPKRVSEQIRNLIQIREQLLALRQFVTSLPGVHIRPGWNPIHDNDACMVSEEVKAIHASAALAHEFSDEAGGRRLMMEPSALSLADPAGETLILSFVRAWERLAEVLGAAPQDIATWLAGRGLMSAVAEALQEWKADAVNGSFLKLRRWNRVRSSFAALEEVGLTSLVEQVRSGSLRPSDVENAVRAGAAQAVLNERLDSTGLVGFDEVERSSITQRFIAGGEDVRAQLVSELPARIIRSRTFQPNQRVGTVANLEQQLGRRRGGMTIRQLLHTFGPLITEITPCFLMSPNSVARFLPADSIDFDVVVFDEASQIRVPDAIGAMGRAKAVVIVGDSQQMPPSSMFASTASGDDSSDESTAPIDMDSILSEAVESKLPSLLLSWHYRSRDESLIAFSNQAYYDGRLSSFPSPPDTLGNRAISLVNVHGTWEGGSRGAARVNRAEAEAIVHEVTRLTVDQPDKTLGVVTFNSQQRDLILDMLESLRETNEAVEAALSRSAEPLFVKNLENVQGDERDIILFTLAFAKGSNGKVPLNWGPLSRPGGEKRLNVAITRAKERVELFSSFEPNDLNLATSHSIGLAHLKDYLLAARSGIEKAGIARTAARDLHLENISKALEAVGLEVRKRVGLSDFTVELAVRASEQGWMALLLDGPNWADRTTVGDRDGLPQTILTESMGWKRVYRVWLPSWLRDSQTIIAEIKELCLTLPPQTVQAAEEMSRPEEFDLAPISPAPGHLGYESGEEDAQQPISLADRFGFEPLEDLEGSLPGLSPHEQRALDEDLLMPSVSASPVRSGLATEEISEMEHEVNLIKGAKGESPETYAPYPAGREAILDASILENTSFHARSTVQSTILKIAATEGPVLLDRLLRLTAAEYGISRLRESRRNDLQQRVPPELVETSASGDTIVWPPDMDRTAYSSYRIPSEGERRDVLEVPYVELRNAMVAVVRRAYSMDSEDALRETAREFGTMRLASKVRPRLESVLENAIAEGLLVRQDDSTIREK